MDRTSPHGARQGAGVRRTAALLVMTVALMALAVVGSGSAMASPDSPAQAVAWARGQLGRPTYQYLCLKFVYDAYAQGAGVDTRGGMATNANTSAVDFWNHFPSLQHRGDTNPPVGAFVFWGPKPGYPDGHVALSTGGGAVVSTLERTTTVIHEFPLRDRAANYLGWIMPPGVAAPTGQPSPTGSGVPFGHLDSVTRAPGGLRAQGWAIDPDTASPIDVHAYSGNGNPGGGNPGAPTRADRDRSDAARVHPGRGAAHGFDVTVPARSAGQQTVCAYGINVGTGDTNPRIGCAGLHVSPDPYGALDTVRRVPGGVEASGWAIDPDSAGSIAVHVYGGNGVPGGGPGAPTTADRDRSDVGTVYPNYGSKHGFTVFLATGPQTQTVCAYGINNGPGTNPRIGCHQI